MIGGKSTGGKLKRGYEGDTTQGSSTHNPQSIQNGKNRRGQLGKA